MPNILYIVFLLQTNQTVVQFEDGEYTYIVFGAKFSDFGQVALVGHHHPSFSLDGLHHESCNIWVLKGFLEKRRQKTCQAFLSVSKITLSI